MNELKHHGVLGMKWGVRRTPEQLGHAPKQQPTKTSKRAKAKSQAKSAAALFGVNIASNVFLGLSGKGMEWYGANQIKSVALTGASFVQLARAGYNYISSGRYE